MSKAASNYADTDHFDQPPPYYTSYEHACLSLISTNGIQLIRFPTEIIDVVRQAIRTSWSLGIQSQNITDNTYEIKLNGNPWHGQGVQSVMARTMMYVLGFILAISRSCCVFRMFILSALYHHGWYLVTSTDISKREFDRDTLVFQLGVRPTETPFFAVSFNEGDKLRLIGAPTELISTVRQAIRPSLIQREELIYSRTAYQFKLCVIIFIV